FIKTYTLTSCVASTLVPKITIKTNCTVLLLKMTQQEFKSIVPEIQDTIPLSIFDFLQNIVSVKRQSPDVATWEPGELEKFKIDLRTVDRLYHTRCFRGAPLRSTVLEGRATAAQLELVVRMKYKSKLVFAELIIDCPIPCLLGSWQNRGRMFVSFDANLFFNAIQTITYKEVMYKLLNEDEHVVNWVYDNRLSMASKRQPPTLSFLCYETICANLEILAHNIQLLPSALRTSLTEFNDIRNSRSCYYFLVYPSALPYQIFWEEDLHWSEEDFVNKLKHWYRWMKLR
ncbi:uncharacterized protein, partial [Procambarus clarkii]|uniref:uncharacterized protein n=1 Tax=Procambarus clarkii TaxID=6728 RepID=UPI003743E231